MRSTRLMSFMPLIFSFLITCLLVSISGAQQKATPPSKKLPVAILDFDSRGGISKEEAASLSDIFQAKLVNMGEFTVVDRNRIKAILQEQGFQQSEACSQVECVVDVGRILKVQKMFAGTIGKVGRIFNVNIQLIDVTTAQIAANESRQYDGELEDLATEIIPEIAQAMAKTLTGKDIKVASSLSSGGSTWYWYVGGAVVAGGVAAAVLLGGGSDGTTLPLPSSLPVGPTYPN